MPVFSHPRCANCHGGMDPFVEQGGLSIQHPPGRIQDQSECPVCHNATQAIKDTWRSARHEGLRFFGKDARQMCEMQSDKVREMSRGSYLNHLNTDTLILAGFDGMAGGARDPDPPDKPLMKHNEFVRAARAWLNMGAGCGAWKGTIAQREEFAANYGYTTHFGKAHVTHHESANSQVNITRDAGVSKGTFTMGGQSNVVTVMQLDGCESTATVTGSWGTDTPADSPVSVTIQIADDGSYTIRFVGPEEKTRSSSTLTSRHNCPGPQIPVPPPDAPLELDWNPWTFTIRCPSPYSTCQLFDPDNRTLSGSFERTILNHEDAADPHSRLTTSLAGNSRSDTGGSLPVKVTAEWDLALTN